MFNKENAYKLVSPEDHREFYDDWANTYDEEFIKKYAELSWEEDNTVGAKSIGKQEFIKELNKLF